MRIAEYWRQHLIERTLTAQQPTESNTLYFPPRPIEPRSLERYTFTSVASPVAKPIIDTLAAVAA